MNGAPQLPFFELAFLNTFLAMQKVFAEPAWGDEQLDLDVWVLNEMIKNLCTNLFKKVYKTMIIIYLDYCKQALLS